jgi:hypothetical protein
MGEWLSERPLVAWAVAFAASSLLWFGLYMAGRWAMGL